MSSSLPTQIISMFMVMALTFWVGFVKSMGVLLFILFAKYPHVRIGLAVIFSCLATISGILFSVFLFLLPRFPCWVSVFLAAPRVPVVSRISRSFCRCSVWWLSRNAFLRRILDNNACFLSLG